MIGLIKEDFPKGGKMQIIYHVPTMGAFTLVYVYHCYHGAIYTRSHWNDNKMVRFSSICHDADDEG